MIESSTHATTASDQTRRVGPKQLVRFVEPPTPSAGSQSIGVDPATIARAPATLRARELMRLQQACGNQAVQRLIQRRPAYLEDCTFLGWPCGGGVNRVMRARLQAAEKRLQDIFDALAPEERIDPTTGKPASTIREWSGLREALGCWHPRGGKHSSGSACDVNYHTNPYIATRTGTTLGGEVAGAGLQAARRAATDVYDRAVQFMGSSVDKADVSVRSGSGATRESTSDVYARFKRTSDALRDYMQFAFAQPDPNNDVVSRRPVPKPEKASEDDLLRLIPEGERLPQDEAVQALEDYMNNVEFAIIHPGWQFDAASQYIRILRDYELVRIPMVYGSPSAAPAKTRNPALGFLDLRQEMVEALVDVGHLRWGACDFGAAESGDMQHFDLGSHGGFTPSDV